MVRPSNQIGIGWAGPTIIHAGTEAQKARYLVPLLAGEEIWCQLFSEPEAGSDLAGLATRATRDGDEWVVEGQKVWTTFAHQASFGILLARTDPGAPKHEGITYFICPMDAPGITIRPIIDMTGDHAFNEVFFDGVRLPASSVVGEVNRGWLLAKVTLGNERVSLSGAGALWGVGPTASDLVDLVKRSGTLDDPVMRHRLASLFAEGEILRILRLRLLAAALAGRPPGPEASVRKALADDHGRKLTELAMDLTGAFGMLADGGPRDGIESMYNAGALPGEGGAAYPSSFWAKAFLYGRALTIGGGTAQVQRNIVGERVLGLPRDIDVEAGKAWVERRTAVAGGSSGG